MRMADPREDFRLLEIPFLGPFLFPQLFVPCPAIDCFGYDILVASSHGKRRLGDQIELIVLHLAIPSTGLEAEAYCFLGIRPASKASLPAIAACFIASAIATGSLALAIAVFSSTPSAPSSSAIATSEAVPTPASTMTGTFACPMIRAILIGLMIPWPEPICEPRGITAAAPASSSLLA